MARIFIICCLIFGSYGSWCNTGYGNLRDTVAYNYNKYIGVTEEGSNNMGEIVEYFQKQAGLDPDKQAWCSAFVVAVFNESGVVHDMNAWSPTCCPNGDGLVYYKKLKNGWKHIPKASVFGLYYSKLGRIGHTGFVDKVDERNSKYIWCVEGNTTIGGSENDGDGVAKRRRNIKTIYKIYDWIEGQEYDSTKVNKTITEKLNMVTNVISAEIKPLISFNDLKWSIFKPDVGEGTDKTKGANIGAILLSLWGVLSVGFIFIKIIRNGK